MLNKSFNRVRRRWLVRAKGRISHTPGIHTASSRPEPLGGRIRLRNDEEILACLGHKETRSAISL